LGYDDYDGLLPPELYREEASGWERTVTTSPDHIFSPAPPAHTTHAKSRFNAIKQPTASTPLLTDSQRTVEFHAYVERQHMPLPLM
jgi:putative membrane protein